MYEYAAEVLRVIDGDTIECRIDLGCSISIVEKIRLGRINCPELGTEAGETAKRFTSDWLAGYSNQVVLRTTKDKREKYGRYLGEVLGVKAGIETSLNDELLESGHAVRMVY